MEGFEELRHIIMDRVKGKKPVGVQTFEEPTDRVEDLPERIVAELVEIKELLQKISEK